jgi:hypothetical protein
VLTARSERNGWERRKNDPAELLVNVDIENTVQVQNKQASKQIFVHIAVKPGPKKLSFNYNFPCPNAGCRLPLRLPKSG